MLSSFILIDLQKRLANKKGLKMDRKIKTLLLPKEHGAWALTFEPLSLALLIAPSLNGFILFFGAAFAFFAHPSARNLLSKKSSGALPFFIFLATATPALIFLTLFILHTGRPVYAPLLLAIFFMACYLILEIFSFERELFTEIMASVSMGLIALSMVLSGGWPLIKSLSFLILLYSRTLGTTIYIHYRLLLLKKRTTSALTGIIIHAIDGLLLLFLLFKKDIPLLGFLAATILIVRALWGMSPLMEKTTVRKLGFTEVFFGLQFIILTTLGYWLGI